MLYEQQDLVPGRDLLFYVHIPKTGGVTVNDAVTAALGEDRCREIRPEALYSYETGLRLAHDKLRRRLVALRYEAWQDWLHFRGRANCSLRRVAYASGHIGLWTVPRHRPARVLLTVREPVDRMISMYFYQRDQLKQAGVVPRIPAKRLPLLETFEEYAETLLARADRLPMNRQCRHLVRDGDVDAACRAVDERIWLAAPTERLPEFIDALSRRSGLSLENGKVLNKGQSRPARLDLPAKLRARLETAMSDDRRLYEHVQAAFDRVAA